MTGAVPFSKVAIVTGSNKGIGLSTVKFLAKTVFEDNSHAEVYLTSRNEERGLAAVEALKKEGIKVHFHQLDIDDETSIIKFAKYIKENHGGIDILINNAGIAFKYNATEPFAQQAKVTIKTNYFSTKKVCEHLFPLLRSGARVANLSSMAGFLPLIPGDHLRNKFASSDSSLSIQNLDGLMKDFIDSAQAGNHKEKGWPNSTYVVSKVGLSALTRIQQREINKDPFRQDIAINHVHPGYVDTDLTSGKGTLSQDEGARSSIFAATLPANTKVKGKYIWADSSLVDWVIGPKPGTKVAIVTGSNKGVGFATVKGLAKKFDGDVYLTSRSEERGLAAVKDLNKQGFNVNYHQLDIDDEESIQKLAIDMMEKYGAIDLLVNNAGIALGDKYSFVEKVKWVTKTNYFSTKMVCDYLFPLLKSGARVVNVSSSVGFLPNRRFLSQELKQKFASNNLTVGELDALMNDFVTTAEAGNHVKKGYENNAYGTSKVGLSALTRIQQREMDKDTTRKDVVINHVHPGWVDTDLSSHMGRFSLEDGAKSSLFAAMLPEGTDIKGQFIWHDCSVLDWVNGTPPGKKVAIVTGSNKGIGYGIVKGLAKRFFLGDSYHDVYLTSRDKERGLAAVKSLADEGIFVHFHQLDINDQTSVEKFASYLKEKHGGIDILVNNAGIAFKSTATESFAEQAKITLQTNYFNTKRACDHFFPLLRSGARVVNVSSLAGFLGLIPGEYLKTKLASSCSSLSFDELDSLMNDFVDSAKYDNLQEKGWPKSTYVVSKVGLSALTRIQQREINKDKSRQDIAINHIHPGLVDTDMTSHRGPMTIERGAESSLFAANLPPDTNIKGEYIWDDCSLVDWVNGPCPQMWKV